MALPPRFRPSVQQKGLEHCPSEAELTQPTRPRDDRDHVLSWDSSTTHFLTLDMDMWPSRTFSLPLLPSQSLRRADGAPAGNPRLQLHGRDRSRHVPQLESRSPAVRKSARMRHPQRGAFPRE